jgi:hypothetical protein
MTLSVLGDALLAKSRHVIQGDCVTLNFTSVVCESDTGNDEYMYWIELLSSEGYPIMKEISHDFIAASDIHDRLKKVIGPAID